MVFFIDFVPEEVDADDEDKDEDGRFFFASIRWNWIFQISSLPYIIILLKKTKWIIQKKKRDNPILLQMCIYTMKQNKSRIFYIYGIILIDVNIVVMLYIYTQTNEYVSGIIFNIRCTNF